MYVCHCRVVSDHSIRTAISAGARDVADVTALCGAGGGCGGCHPSIEELLAEAAVAIREPERARTRQGRRRHEAPLPAVGLRASAS
jgi:bacterioferritin-associated ferredoxin